MQLSKSVKSVGTIPVRIADNETSLPDTESIPPEKFVMIALARIHKNLSKMARQQDDSSRPVDEYQGNATYNAAQLETSLEVQPQFDVWAEMIHSVLVTGPASTAFQLQLGDRYFNVLTDVSGRFLLSNIAMMLSRNDRRLLTSSTAGSWTLELMGFADERY
jgi:hypothetical protein